MTIPIFRSSEVLYTVTVRDPQARKLLTAWSTANRNSQIRVDDTHMYIYDQNTLSAFMVTWAHGWNNISIWDNWAKRHINL